MTQANDPLTSGELDELLWDNYFSLTATPIQAIRYAWQEIEDGSLPYWANEEFGITIYDLISSLARLSQRIVDTALDPTETAFSALRRGVAL